MLGAMFSRSSRHSLQQEVPVRHEPVSSQYSDMSSVFAMPFSQLQDSPSVAPTLQPTQPDPVQRSTSLRRARLSARISLPARPRISSRDNSALGLPAHNQPLRMLFFGAHGARLFSGRLRRGRSEEPMSYESMLALDEHNPRRAVRAHVLDGLQTVRSCEGDECRICMEPWKRGMHQLQLPCGHAFCTCVRSWLESNHSCPICRWCFADHDTYIVHHPP